GGAPGGTGCFESTRERRPPVIGEIEQQWIRRALIAGIIQQGDILRLASLRIGGHGRVGGDVSAQRLKLSSPNHVENESLLIGENIIPNLNLQARCARE